MARHSSPPFGSPAAAWSTRGAAGDVKVYGSDESGRSLPQLPVAGDPESQVGTRLLNLTVTDFT